MSGIKYKVLFEDSLDHMEVETVLISPINNEVGIAVLSTLSINPTEKQVYVYSLIWNRTLNSYTIDKELQSFLFRDLSFAKEFIEHLPEMSAFELMFAMNSISISTKY
ncbi:hypothetical protein D0469_09055 [Peribacillus saganii]|uniref:Uncharacterized protein n=1 Tax=Peribacillus saganii TaxID=2303992 RepID=A0A372LPX0_9BACI|nr:hypothetical protein [Peribacillus saganii]RFU69503.1 hypothetical protein D0469_09055 [Peribacillus saganii]